MFRGRGADPAAGEPAVPRDADSDGNLTAQEFDARYAEVVASLAA